MLTKISMSVYPYLAGLVFMASFLFPASHVQAEENFFKGKTIRWIASSTPGGGTDTLVRLQARHFGKHVPGNPRIIVVNMPGAGGVIAANYLWNRARPDGLTFSSMNTGLIYRVATRDERAKFVLEKFTWLGQVAAEGNLVYIRTAAPYKSFDDIKKAARKPKMGAQSRSHNSNVVLKVVERVFPGVEFDVVYGYPGTPEILLDIERGALDGRAHSIGSFMSTKRDWIESGFVRSFGISSPTRDPRLPDVPTFAEQASPEKENLLEALYAVQGRASAMPPGVPPERAKILRDAYAAMHKDPEFIKDAEKLGWDLSLRTGAELNEKFEKLTKDEELMDLFRKVLKGD